MDPNELVHLIASNENWLAHRVLQNAKKQDYIKYTSTLAEAWRASVEGMSETLFRSLALYNKPPELSPDEDYSKDSVALFGKVEAQRHRARGVSLSMFLGRMKYYRQSYIDLVLE